MVTLEARVKEAIGELQFQVLALMTENETLKARVQELEAKQAQPEATGKD